MVLIRPPETGVETKYEELAASVAPRKAEAVQRLTVAHYSSSGASDSSTGVI